MLNANNQIIARSIGAAYCNANLVCQDSLFNRLNTFFDDNSFLSFLATLQSRAYLIGGFENLGSLPGELVKIKFVYFDVISGAAGSGIKVVPAVLFTQNNFEAILQSFDSSLHFVKKNTDGSIIFFNSSQGYEIAYTTTPTPGGGELNTGGAIIVPDELTPGGVNVIETPAATSGFNLNDLLIPGAILAGLYLVMKK